MSEIYNIATITAELLLIAVVIYQRYTIVKLKKDLKGLNHVLRRAEKMSYILCKELTWCIEELKKYVESDTDTNGSADGSVVCVHNDDSKTERQDTVRSLRAVQGEEEA